MIAVKILLFLIVGYLFGNISFAYIIGKLNHVDIRTQGSGNAGTTNAMRTLGKKAGIFTYIGDALKTFVPTLLMAYLFAPALPFSLVVLITGFGVVIGHNYPFWLGFKGGKGIAVTSAVIIVYCCMVNPWLILAYIALFFSIVFGTKYVSVGSLIVVFVFMIQVAVCSIGQDLYPVEIFFGCMFCASGFFAHRSNIKRLLNGTENKIGSKKNKSEE